MNEKGFTLVELLAVIAILSIVSLIAIPSINTTIKASRQSAYDAQVKNLKIGAKEWGADHIYSLPSAGRELTIDLRTLKQGGYADSNITNPKTKKKLSDTCTKIKIKNSGTKLTYTVTIVDEPKVCS